ncbi:MAG: hypothetical protein FD167_134 [bacterium]|nr:MAG: hypothetical protein FD167_134 [bacterium]
MDFFISTTFRLEIVRGFFVLVFLLLASSQTFAHCAMCKTTLEQATNNSTVYLTLAALSLFIPALVFFLVMLLVIYKYR